MYVIIVYIQETSLSPGLYIFNHRIRRETNTCQPTQVENQFYSVRFSAQIINLPNLSMIILSVFKKSFLRGVSLNIIKCTIFMSLEKRQYSNNLSTQKLIELKTTVSRIVRQCSLQRSPEECNLRLLKAVQFKESLRRFPSRGL